MKMLQFQMRAHLFLLLCLLFNCLCRFHCTTADDVQGYLSKKIKSKAMAPDIAPSADPPPFIPLIAPSPLIPFTNRSLPSLSGFCSLNFSAVASLISKTATDCWDSSAPYLANVICCPQFDASLAILMGQYSKISGMLYLDKTNARNCLSDFQMILESQGANNQLQNLCSIRPENLTEASCPVSDVKKFESIADTSRLLAACGKVDTVKECCHQVCQSAILDSARKIARNGTSDLPENSTRIDDCKNIVFRWLTSKLNPSSANDVLRGLSNCKVNKGAANDVLRGLSNCKVNKGCPLSFPSTINVTKECGYMISNQTGCCKAMENYLSHLQKQSFITNLQALNCAASLGMELQKANVSNNVYDLCHISLKDFSLQVGTKDSGCLLPSSPSDVTYDEASGIGFICDLNDNIEATWPSTSILPGSCNETTKLPALPTATSAQSGLYKKKSVLFPLLFSSLLVLTPLI